MKHYSFSHVAFALLFVVTGVSIGFTSARAQRSLGANKFILDDGLGHTLTLQMSTPATGGTLTLPGNGGNIPSIQNGASASQTLYWNNTNKDWEASSVLTNDGVSQVGFTGQLTGTSANANYTGSITNTNASTQAALLVNEASTIPPSTAVAGVGVLAAGKVYGVCGTTTATTAGAGLYGSNGIPTFGIAIAPPAGIFGVTTASGVGIVAVSYGAGSGAALTATSTFGSTSDAADFTGNVFIGGELTQTISSASYGASITNTNSATKAALLVNAGSTLPPIFQPGVGTMSGGAQYGVLGTTTANVTTTGAGVYGANTNLTLGSLSLFPAPGVEGSTFTPGPGILAISSNAGSGTAFQAESIFGSTADAGDFYGNVYVQGNLNVTGTVSKGGGSFKIDDPIDPANKYLYHSFVESPDMMNIYNGNVVLDANGEATVTMPAWFEALNQDFRYQLTSIGSFAPVYVATEISGNVFRIAGGKSGQKISWMVTGIRHDAFANAHRIPTEIEKDAVDKGYYLYPEVAGKPAEQGIGARMQAKTTITQTGPAKQ